LTIPQTISNINPVMNTATTQLDKEQLANVLKDIKMLKNLILDDFDPKCKRQINLLSELVRREKEMEAANEC
jgi:hypothetical protein